MAQQSETTGQQNFIELLLSGAALLGAGLYVVLNVAYVSFYESLGTRPEEVGLGRLAVLARASAIAAAALYVIAAALLVARILLTIRVRAAATAQGAASPGARPSHQSQYYLALLLPLAAVFLLLLLIVGIVGERT